MTREQKRLRVNGLIVLVSGVALAITAWSPLYPLAKVFLTLAHWPFFDAPEVMDPTGRLMLAIGGGLTAGLGAMMWSVGTQVMPVAPAQGRRVVLNTAVVWFVTDSTFSIVAGSGFNAVLTLIFLALMLGALDWKQRDAVA